ncbi:hypothetical protein K431DRAFT_290588 [Polychaeton citri CBS 116435]|uniref:Ribosomal RNA-processing protein 17 n=1 Tax=Polychaeton citri CBS 116435 TaxID=1314669 RepID=A0A9P4QIQ2_9PEZI|nr:hypothetical protein K431DRAFT_290588 [Polychaeton citri CBS 116435]
MAPLTKRRKLDQPEEIKFDLSARQDYLSGYRRRKQARIQHAREVAIKKEKEEKTKERRELREQRKEELADHVKAVNAELKKQNKIINGEDGEQDDDEVKGSGDSNADFEGFADEPSKPELPSDDEFVDEDKFTTVTVEAMGESEDGSEDEVEAAVKAEAEGKSTSTETPTNGKPQKRVWTKHRPADAAGRSKQKKRKFRYESKGERALTRKKQGAKNKKAAEARRGRE